ncbi:related to 3-hydroxyacyl-CoA dehydrogenase [Rhynchosporium secalis]|uniref:Related to 3-hydroxyacyl-CoA dehydrogenase n=1 Tax=Rhynchosporium secalis TaxID=38038 RepID=A0A1E1LYN0_RHYSE|nr:related to 3-hydroxyacyl-CoA dehydrogenase [Rhynchosporium secalis]
MSASRLRTVSNVWPPWLPGTLTGVENHLLASQTAPPPLLSMASFKTLSTTSISSPRTIPRVARPNRLLRSAATLPNYASIPSTLFQPQPQHNRRQIRLFHQHRQQSNINKQSREFETAAQSVKPQTSAYEPAESNLVPTWAPPASLEDRPVCIIGAGVLGRRLAVLWASRSRPVALYDTSSSALKSSRAFIAGELATYCAENGTQPGHVSFSSTLEDAVQNAWMVIEAVPEDLEVKISLLGQLDRIVAKDVVIATNSEGFRSQELVGEVSIKGRVLNTLYYIPPKNKCAEMMSCGYTSPSVILFLAGEMKGMGLNPIAVPGGGNKSMIFPRIWSAVKKETLKILSEGQADPEEVDVLFRDFFGSEKGVCEMMDEVGLDTVLKSEKSRLPNTRGSDCFWGAKGEEHVEWLQREFVGKGKLGLKTGEGLIVKRRRSVEGKKAKDSAGQEAWEKHSVDVCGL